MRASGPEKRVVSARQGGHFEMAVAEVRLDGHRVRDSGSVALFGKGALHWHIRIDDNLLTFGV